MLRLLWLLLQQSTRAVHTDNIRACLRRLSQSNPKHFHKSCALHPQPSTVGLYSTVVFMKTQWAPKAL